MPSRARNHGTASVVLRIPLFAAFGTPGESGRADPASGADRTDVGAMLDVTSCTTPHGGARGEQGIGRKREVPTASVGVEFRS